MRRGARPGIARLAAPFLLALLATLSRGVRADAVASLSALKAAYTLHFLNLIRWEQPDAWLYFCVLGESETGDRMLLALDKKTVHGQSIRARRLPRDGSDQGRCDALYIPEKYAAYAPALLKRHETTPTVTISDVPHFANDGGVIGFAVVEERLRFDVNEGAATKKRLKISAKLRELAREVIR